MAGTFRLSSAVGGNLSPYQAATLPGLPASARLLITILDRRAKGHPECWCGNSTLAGLLKCCERTIRNALKALEGAGLVRVVHDYALKSRRRIVLLWRRSVDASVTANVAVQVAANMCSAIVPPPDPPIVEPDGNTLKENDDDEFARGTADANPEDPSSSFPKLEDLIGTEPEAPPVVDGPPPTPKATRKATPEEIAAVEEKAYRIWGESQETKSRVHEAAKEYTLSWTDSALDIAAAKAAKTSIGFGLVFGILKRFSRAGGPPPKPSPKPAPHTVSQRTPMEPPAEPDAADLDDLRLWAKSSDPILSKFGRAALAKRGEKA